MAGKHKIGYGRGAGFGQPIQEFKKEELAPHFRKCENCGENDVRCALSFEGTWECEDCHIEADNEEIGPTLTEKENDHGRAI